MKETEVRKYIESAEKSPGEIARAVAGLHEKGLRYKPNSEEWCILEILGHLADMEIVYAYRIRQMIADENPIIAPVDQNAWARNLDYLRTPAPELVAAYGLNRHRTVELLRKLQPQQFENGAMHPELNRKVTVAEMLEKVSGHGANHLQQIERLKKEAKDLS